MNYFCVHPKIKWWINESQDKMVAILQTLFSNPHSEKITWTVSSHGPINNMSIFVLVTSWCQTGDKTLSDMTNIFVRKWYMQRNIRIWFYLRGHLFQDLKNPSMTLCKISKNHFIDITNNASIQHMYHILEYSIHPWIIISIYWSYGIRNIFTN